VAHPATAAVTASAPMMSFVIDSLPGISSSVRLGRPLTGQGQPDCQPASDAKGSC
jgi:hypothetical protein